MTQNTARPGATHRITTTVIMTTFNRAEYLPQALDSLLQQTHAPAEIILIDDGSTDATPEIAARYADRIRYFRQANQGKPAALNDAIPRATGSHICVFDDDDVMLADALETHTRFLESNPDIDYSYGHNWVYDESSDDRTEGRIWNENAWRAGGVIESPPEELFLRTMEWNGVFLQSMLIPKQCLLDVGLFADTLLRGEDYDMMLRLARRFRGASVGLPVFVWRNHSGVRGPASERHGDRDRTAIFHRYEQRVFRNLRQELNLGEYLARGSDGPAVNRLSAEQRDRALLQRCRVMFARGLYAEGAKDVRLLLQEPTLNPATMQQLLDLVVKTANIGERDYMMDAPGLAHGLCTAGRSARGQAVLSAAMKGLYWSLSKRLRQGSAKSSWYLTRALAIIAYNKATNKARARTSTRSASA